MTSDYLRYLLVVIPGCCWSRRCARPRGIFTTAAMRWSMPSSASRSAMTQSGQKVPVLLYCTYSPTLNKKRPHRAHATASCHVICKNKQISSKIKHFLQIFLFQLVYSNKKFDDFVNCFLLSINLNLFPIGLLVFYEIFKYLEEALDRHR